MRRVAAQLVFTTHTPVPAGHDRFAPDLVEEHVGPLRDALGLSYESFIGLGRVNPLDEGEEFCMTVLALKVCRRANAVSSLHGQVSRAMWIPLYPGIRDDHIPIGHITNGVHVHTWLAPQMRQVYDRHLGADWPDRSSEPGFWEGIDAVDDGEIWEAHQTLKTRLIQFTRRRAIAQAERRGESAATIEQLRRALSLDTLTMGLLGDLRPTSVTCCWDIEALTSLVTRADARAVDLRGQAVAGWSARS
jgi:starch phosphorylase